MKILLHVLYKINKQTFLKYQYDTILIGLYYIIYLLVGMEVVGKVVVQ